MTFAVSVDLPADRMISYELPAHAIETVERQCPSSMPLLSALYWAAAHLAASGLLGDEDQAHQAALSGHLGTGGQVWASLSINSVPPLGGDAVKER